MHEIAYFYPDGHEAHFARQHPERPERVESVVESIRDAGYWDAYPKLPAQSLSDHILTGVHTKNHLEYLENVSRRGGSIDPDTYLTEASWRLALQAAGGGVAVVNSVWDRKAKRGFALTRPPGHHATSNRAMGFCLLNNIALSCEYLLQEMEANKIAVVDLDLHHGNGTQDIFYQRSDVLFISTHQFPLYPGTGRLHETGAGNGEWFNLNLPLPPFSGDQAFTVSMEKVILPILTRFQPEIVLVSAGFDSHWRDPLGNLLISAEVYGKLVENLVAFADDQCNGRIALFMEGGYDLVGGSACALSAVCALLGESFKDEIGPAPWAESGAWRSVVDTVCNLWGL